MLKNNRGVTLTVLVVTIIIMLILAAVTMSININTNKTVDLKEIVVNMELIKTSAQGFADRYIGEVEPEEEEDVLPGYRPTYINTLMGTIIGTTQEDDTPIELSQRWYQLDDEAFKEMGIDIKLDGEEAYFVDYETMNVAYVKSTIPVNGVYPGIVTKNSKSGVPGGGNSGSVLSGEKVVYFYDQIKNLKTDDIGN